MQNGTLKATDAIIYVRVSSKKQLLTGDGLGGQEKRCKDYAAFKGYKLIGVFTEKGITGGILDRPAMRELLQFLATRKQPTVIIIEDIERFARDLPSHLHLRVAISKRGGILES